MRAGVRVVCCGRRGRASPRSRVPVAPARGATGLLAIGVAEVGGGVAAGAGVDGGGGVSAGRAGGGEPAAVAVTVGEWESVWEWEWEWEWERAGRRRVCSDVVGSSASSRGDRSLGGDADSGSRETRVLDVRLVACGRRASRPRPPGPSGSPRRCSLPTTCPRSRSRWRAGTRSGRLVVPGRRAAK